MRWLLLLPFPAALHAQEPQIPEHRWWAPSSAEALALLSCDRGTFSDTVFTGSHRLKPAYEKLSGIVFRMHGDTTLASLEQYAAGRRSGTWYTLDLHERVTELTEYAPDTTHRSYWYDEHGRLTYYCAMDGCPDDICDRIFGGWCPGSCWSFDPLGRVTYFIDTPTAEEQTIIHYYPNGQMAERRWHSRAEGRIEQWCPRGERIAHCSIVADRKTGTSVRRGTLIQWSIADHSYYLVRLKNERTSLRRIPGGRWRTYAPAEYAAVDKRSRLRNVIFGDPERPAELPCGLPRQ